MYSEEAAASKDGRVRLGPVEQPLPQLASRKSEAPWDRYVGVASPHLRYEQIGLPTAVHDRSQSSIQPSKGRHVTFSSREPHLDKATGNIEHVQVSPRNMSPSQTRRRFPRSFSYTPDPRTERGLSTKANSDHAMVLYDGEDDSQRHDRLDTNRTRYLRSSQDSEEEHFVDGNFFFNHLVRNKEAEDYNMAEMLRERSRELQRHQLFGRDATLRTFDRQRVADRLSTSLPTDYLMSKYRYYANKNRRNERNGEERVLPASRQPLQDMSFADGLEIEIPPRRHGGLGGGGLRQSLSADRLLMVPPTHRDPAEFGRHYFRPGRFGEESVVPSSYSATNLFALPLHVETKPPVAPGKAGLKFPSTSHDTKEFCSQRLRDEPTQLRHAKSSSVSNTGRYNVRTGQFEPMTELTSGMSTTGQFQTVDRIHYPGPNSPRDATDRVGDFKYRQRNVNDPSQAMQSGHGLSQSGAPRLVVPADVDQGRTENLGNQTWSAQSSDPHRLRLGDPRLSSSWDPTRFRTLSQQSAKSQALEDAHRAQQVPRLYSTSFQTPVPQEYPSMPDRFQGNDASGRKAVTWRDQASEPSPPTASFHLNLSRTHPTGNFQDNLGYCENLEDTAAGPNETRSISREGTHYPSNDSLLRSLSVSDLHNVDQFALFEVSTSKLGWAESFMGTNWVDEMKQYKFVVLNRHEEVLFIGTEEDGTISNCILSPYKSSFKVRILDANGQDVMHFRRLYPVKSKTNFVLGSKRKYRLEVATPSGHVIGNVEKTYDSDTYYVLEDRAGECLFLIQRSCICTCPLFWDYEYKILLPEGETEVGEISWSYLTAQNEQFNGTEISFPIDLNTTSKIMLLGVCFLLNFSRWQSAYLDVVCNQRKQKDVATLLGSRLSVKEENREIAALLKTSPDENGFYDRNPEKVREEEEEKLQEVK